MPSIMCTTRMYRDYVFPLSIWKRLMAESMWRRRSEVLLPITIIAIPRQVGGCVILDRMR